MLKYYCIFYSLQAAQQTLLFLYLVLLFRSLFLPVLLLLEPCISSDPTSAVYKGFRFLIMFLSSTYRLEM